MLTLTESSIVWSSSASAFAPSRGPEHRYPNDCWRFYPDGYRALAKYARAMTRLSKVIGDHDPSLIGTTFRSRGTRQFYQVRIGAETRAEADGLCAQIRRAGEACFVLRNRG